MVLVKFCGQSENRRESVLIMMVVSESLYRAICQAVGQSNRLSVSELVSRLVGLSVVWFAGRYISKSVGWSVNLSASLSVGRSVIWSVDRSVSLSASLSDLKSSHGIDRYSPVLMPV